MVINEIKQKMKCDFSGCRNMAKFSFCTKGMFKRDLSFCESCMKDLYQVLGKFYTPKGIESPFKLNKKLKRDMKEVRDEK